MKNSLTALLGIIVIGLILINQVFFIVPEGSQALVFQFGRIVGSPKTDAGLYFKIPLIQNVQYLEKRILNWDGEPDKVPTLEKKYIYVDTTARWKITDALVFRNSLESVVKAQNKIQNILDSATKSIITKHHIVEAVRNTNIILDRINKKKEELAKLQAEGLLEAIEEEVTGEIPEISVGRERLSKMIKDIAYVQLKKFGIDLIDVQLRRIAYEESVQEKVYDRMISERNRIAEKIRSIGKGEQAKIRGKISLDLQQIKSTAYKKIQEIKGKSEAEAIKIYATAIKQDKSFYEFFRTLEAYREGIKGDSRIILSTDSPFLKLLTEGVLK